MRVRSILVAVSLASIGCSERSDPDGGALARPSEAEPTPAVSPSNADALRKHVEALASDAMAGRPTPSAELDRAASYIEGVFERAGVRPLDGLDGYHQRFACGESSTLSSNVVGVVRGRDPQLQSQFVLVSAHYDHLGRKPARGDAPADADAVFNGANDNASGVAAMLEIAVALASAPPRRSVLFVAFCGEELGMRGSSHFVGQPPVELTSIVANFNFEMLGWPEREAPKLWVTGSEYSTLFDRLASEPSGGKPGQVAFVHASSVGPVEGNAFERSDNAPLARAGVVAHSISTGRIGPLYHSVDDEIEAMDFETMSKLVEALTQAVRTVADADDRPQWTSAGNAAGYR